MDTETIVAVATPPGRGGVAILRLSGPLAYAIALQVVKKESLPPRQATFCTFTDKNGEIFDKGLVIYFQAPHSFTGEEVIELHGHGSPVAVDNLLHECLNLGAKLAKPGEFSERAFLNNKIDLTQAEAIADLINASSQTAARMAVRTLQGEFSKKIAFINEKIIELRLFVEAAIDFPEEEVDFLGDGTIAIQLAEILHLLALVRNNAAQGVMIREGITVVIAGRPNAGKSTLINFLAGREVAIVSDVAGTTRDVMREHILLDDIPLHLIDTAGLRHSDDVVEKEGIKRAWREVRQADCVLAVMDVNEPDGGSALSAEIRHSLFKEVPIIDVFNKIDCLGLPAKQVKQAVYLSAKTGEGMPLLKEKIKEAVGYQVPEGQFLARRRHLCALDLAKDCLLAGQQQLTLHRAGELLAEDLRRAHQALGEVTGEFSSDDLLGRIFSSFCIGK